jgi:tight adherence protein B
MQMLLLAAVFLATLGIVLGAYLFVNRRQLAERAAVRARLHGEAEAVADQQSILKHETASQIGFLNDLLRGRKLTERLQTRLALAGSTQNPGVFLTATALLAIVGLAAGSRFGALGAIALGVVGGLLPTVWLRSRTRKRIAAFEKQLPEALDMMANAMKAGYSFQAAARFLSEEVPDPLGPEFGRFYDEQRLGIDVRTALLSMQSRIDSLNLKMFITAVLIQRETGGNLTELLVNLSTLMRDRVALKGQIDTLAAEPKLSGRFLALLPVVLFLMLGFLNPNFVAPFRDSSLGHLMLGTAAVFAVIGYMIMMKMADIDV